jgi:hypothetical protein
LKATPQTHPDYKVIQATIDKMKQVADSVNKSTAQQENLAKLYELKELLVGFPEVSFNSSYSRFDSLSLSLTLNGHLRLSVSFWF